MQLWPEKGRATNQLRSDGKVKHLCERGEAFYAPDQMKLICFQVTNERSFLLKGFRAYGLFFK